MSRGYKILQLALNKNIPVDSDIHSESNKVLMIEDLENLPSGECLFAEICAIPETLNSQNDVSFHENGALGAVVQNSEESDMIIEINSVLPNNKEVSPSITDSSTIPNSDVISDESDNNISITPLVPYSDNSSDSESSLEEYPLKSKTRQKRFQVNEQEWYNERNRKLREAGRKYLGRKKKYGKWVYDIKKEPRSMKKRCSCKETNNGLLKCYYITEDDRRKLFEDFWKLTWPEKKTLVDSTESIIPTKRHRDRKIADSSRRSQTILYHLRINEQNMRVCRVMFLNTFSIGRMTVIEWKRNVRAKSNCAEEKKAAKVKPFCNENKELVDFIESLPTLESHYCRASTKKKYLLPEWQSKQSLYRFYVNDWCKAKDISPLSITTFSHTLETYNIALFHPKKDQCEICSAYKVGHVTEEEYSLHITRKMEARCEKENDKANESYVFTMDLQAVLMAPKSKISSLYYKTKLCVHNLCYYNLGNHDGFCYIWNETEGGVNSEEFATICSRFITEKVLPTIDRENIEDPIKIILYSDGCTYQNRNVTITNALLNVAMHEKVIIVQKYLEVGHTQMEADSMHSMIERNLKDKIINVPAEYYGVCRSARRNPNKYDVTYLNHTFFKNFKEVEFLKSIRPGKIKGDAKVTDIRALKYNPDGQVYYKLRYTDEWELLPQRHTRGVSPCPITELEQLHSDRLKIKSRKFMDLQSLKRTLADDYHNYYDAIPHA